MTPPFPSSRRDLLRLAAVTATTAWVPRSAWSQPRLSPEAFSLGVASGCPMHDSVVLWTRLTGRVPNQPVTVQWEIADDEGFTRIAQRGQSQALPQLAHSVHVEPAGLQPDRWYFYRFMAGDALSATGRTRTFPAPDAQAARLRVAYASCQRWEHGYFSAWKHMAQEQLDAVLFLGDYIYEYGNAAQAVRRPPGGVVLTLDDYRGRYALHRGEPDLQAMHAQVPWLFAWDDHEVQNDYAGLTPGDGQQAPDFTARRAAAYQAYYEHMPLRASMLTRAVEGLLQGAELRIHSQQRFGRLANIVMLDDRQYRDRQACNRADRPLGSTTLDPATCPEWEDPRRSLLRTAQEQWLDGAFANGREGWTVLGMQTLLGPRAFRAPDGGRREWNDGWDGYAPARRRLLDSVRKNGVADLAVFGGDVHENWVGHVKADYAQADSPAIGVEFCGTSITARSGGNARVQQTLANNPHFVFADGERKGYGVAEFTPKAMTATLRVVDDVTRRETKVETLAAFHVEAGKHRVERA